jgi:hypothetical protein
VALGFDSVTGTLQAMSARELEGLFFIIQNGKNYGWRCYEATWPITPMAAAAEQLHVPARRPVTASAVTGGYVSRRACWPQNIFLYGDYGSGRVWGIGRQPAAHSSVLIDAVFHLVIRQDRNGEVYSSTTAAAASPHRKPALGSSTRAERDGLPAVRGQGRFAMVTVASLRP